MKGTGSAGADWASEREHQSGEHRNETWVAYTADEQVVPVLETVAALEEVMAVVSSLFRPMPQGEAAMTIPCHLARRA